MIATGDSKKLTQTLDTWVILFLVGQVVGINIVNSLIRLIQICTAFKGRCVTLPLQNNFDHNATTKDTNDCCDI